MGRDGVNYDKDGVGREEMRRYRDDNGEKAAWVFNIHERV